MAAATPERLALVDIELALQEDVSERIDAIFAAMVRESFVVVALPAPVAAELQQSLNGVGGSLAKLHGQAPRHWHCSAQFRSDATSASSWSRRTFFHYDRNDAKEGWQEGPTWPQPLPDAVRAAAEADIVLQRVRDAVTAVLKRRTPELHEKQLTRGQFDAFFYPSDEASAEDEAAAQEAAYDDTCPCPSHVDPGVCTIVAESVSALEAKLASGWHRLHLRNDELCVVLGKTFDKLTGGRIRGCEHRVANTAAERFSFVFEIHVDVPEEPEPELESAQSETTAAADSTNAATCAVDCHLQLHRASMPTARAVVAVVRLRQMVSAAAHGVQRSFSARRQRHPR